MPSKRFAKITVASGISTNRFFDFSMSSASKIFVLSRFSSKIFLILSTDFISGTRKTLFLHKFWSCLITFSCSSAPNDKSGKVKNFLPSPFLSQSFTIGNLKIFSMPVIRSSSPLFPNVADINILCFALTNASKNIVGATQGRMRIFLFAKYILHSFKFSDIF